MNKLLQLVFIPLICSFIAGCSSYVPMSRPDNCLNTYNTYWDNFSGTIEIGKVYQYSNDGFDKALRFKVLQVLENGVLVVRYKEWGEIWDKHQVICEEVVFAIASNHKYADGAALRNGFYECTGTWTYMTNQQTEKTVYCFVERKCQPQQDNRTNSKK